MVKKIKEKLCAKNRGFEILHAGLTFAGRENVQVLRDLEAYNYVIKH